MKQLLFLLLFPCLALAQYQGNANQKITLGEQTTADGLVWRGRLADTANLLTNKLDTSVYIVLDTGTRAMWYYQASTTPKWTRLVDSLNNLQGQLSLTSKVTGTLPVANGGTNTSTAFTAGSIVFAGSGGAYTQSNANLFHSVNFTRIKPVLLINDATNIDASLGIQLSTTGSGTATYFAINKNNNYGMLIGYDERSANGFGGIGSYFRNVTADPINFLVNNATNTMQLIASGDILMGFLEADDKGAYKLQVKDSVYVGGNVSASAYTTRSDYDLKDEIQNISYGINEVMQMQPVKYTYKSNGSTQLGFIAQDLGVITPEVVSFEDKMSVYYNALIPILTKAIQEQQALIKALEQRIINLENK